MLRVAASVTVALAVLVGCGAAGDPGSGIGSVPGAESGDVAEPGDVSGAQAASASEPLFALPLDAVLPLRDPMTAWRFDRALDTALARCVRDAGAVLAVPDRPEPASPWVHERRYGAMRPDEAAKWGYRPPPVDGVDALLAAQAAIGPRARAALDGVGGEPGCLDLVGGAIARRDDPRWSSFLAVESMLNSTLEAAAEQPPVQAAIDRWSDCLHDATGRRFAHPAEPLSVFVDGDEAGAEERRVASADAACKHSVGLIDRWAAEESGLQEALLSDREDLVAEAMALQLDILAAVDAQEAPR